MLAYLFVLFAIAFRFMPHPMAFTPVGAALLYFGARAPRRRLWIPLVLLAASDVLLTTLFYKYPFSWDHFVTWAWYAAMLGLGTTLKQNAGAFRILGSALAGTEGQGGNRLSQLQGCVSEAERRRKRAPRCPRPERAQMM